MPNDIDFIIADARRFWSPAAVAERKKNNQRISIRFALNKDRAIMQRMREMFKLQGAIVGKGISSKWSKAQ